MMTQYPKIYLYKRIVQAKLFIDNHFDEQIELDNIADEAFFSKFHFIRIFKNIYGKTPHQYLIHVRIEKAKQFLRNNKSVSASCHEVGFESISSFTALFKKLTGITPSLYLQQQQHLNSRQNQFPLQFIPGCHTRITKINSDYTD
jgi:AraC-like DNA-binding protein